MTLLSKIQAAMLAGRNYVDDDSHTALCDVIDAKQAYPSLIYSALYKRFGFMDDFVAYSRTRPLPFPVESSNAADIIVNSRSGVVYSDGHMRARSSVTFDIHGVLVTNDKSLCSGREWESDTVPDRYIVFRDMGAFVAWMRRENRLQCRSSPNRYDALMATGMHPAGFAGDIFLSSSRIEEAFITSANVSGPFTAAEKNSIVSGYMTNCNNHFVAYNDYTVGFSPRGLVGVFHCNAMASREGSPIHGDKRGAFGTSSDMSMALSRGVGIYSGKFTGVDRLVASQLDWRASDDGTKLAVFNLAGHVNVPVSADVSGFALWAEYDSRRYVFRDLVSLQKWIDLVRPLSVRSTGQATLAGCETHYIADDRYVFVPNHLAAALFHHKPYTSVLTAADKAVLKLCDSLAFIWRDDYVAARASDGDGATGVFNYSSGYRVNGDGISLPDYTYDQSTKTLFISPPLASAIELACRGLDADGNYVGHGAAMRACWMREHTPHKEMTFRGVFDPAVIGASALEHGHCFYATADTVCFFQENEPAVLAALPAGKYVGRVSANVPFVIKTGDVSFVKLHSLDVSFIRFAKPSDCRGYWICVGDDLYVTGSATALGTFARSLPDGDYTCHNGRYTSYKGAWVSI